jgi:Na+/H+-dicarboxylate symporter
MKLAPHAVLPLIASARRISEVPLIAFSTSSSNATLPVTIETAEEDLGAGELLTIVLTATLASGEVMTR